jgi:hypothetical protein
MPPTFDCFLTHDWGMDELERDNHQRVARVHRALTDAKLRAWFDAEEMRGEGMIKMVEGVEASDMVVVFITKRYCVKVSGRGADGSNDNCKFEYNVALKKKGIDRMVPVVMEPRCLDTRKWSGVVAGTLGTSTST